MADKYFRDPLGIARLFAINQYLGTVPLRLASGNYTAELDQRHLPHVIIWIVRDEHGNVVGTLHDNDYYSEGRVQYSIKQLVWKGASPTGYPKNPDGALCFDGGPCVTHQGALDRLAKQADKLRAWREANAEVAHG